MKNQQICSGLFAGLLMFHCACANSGGAAPGTGAVNAAETNGSDDSSNENLEPLPTVSNANNRTGNPGLNRLAFLLKCQITGDVASGRLVSTCTDQTQAGESEGQPDFQWRLPSVVSSSVVNALGSCQTSADLSRQTCQMVITDPNLSYAEFDFELQTSHGTSTSTLSGNGSGQFQ